MAMASRRFPPPWSIEERQESFIVKDANASSSRRHFGSDGGQLLGHRLHCAGARRAEAVALCDPGRIVVAEPDLAVGVLPDQRLERQIDAGRLPVLHQRGAAFGIAE